MAAVSISAYGLDALARGFAAAPDMARAELLETMHEATMLLEREVKDAMPAVSGLTRASITADAWSTPAGVLGVVGSAQISAAAVELGTRPHMPPVQALVPWVQEKLGVPAKDARSVAFLVARKIARSGTPAQAPFQRTLQRQASALQRLFEGAAQRIATRLAGQVGGDAA